MKAVGCDGFGGPEVLRIHERDRPQPGPGEVLIEIEAASVNRPDLIQREGRYPPPPGESDVPGLDGAGRIVDVGEGVSGFRQGDAVMALLAGGGYAEYAIADAGHVMHMPAGLDFTEAACIPEAYITAWQNLFLNGRLGAGEAALLHGGGGGVNTAAIQIARALVPDCHLIVTASPAKIERVCELGADCVIDYRNEDFLERTRAFTQKRGVDVVLDHIGPDYLERNLASLATGGRLVLIANMSGREATIDLGRVLVKRLTIVGSVLRPRSREEKSRIVAEFSETVLPHVASGRIRPIIHTVLPLDRAADAHRLMQAGGHFGKIVLTPRGAA